MFLPRFGLVVLVRLINFPDGRPQAGTQSKGTDTDVSAGQGDHFGVQNTIGDLLRHPAFTGFAHLILPWDDRNGVYVLRHTRCWHPAMRGGGM